MRLLLTLITWLAASLTLCGQVAVKTNVLYDAATTPNLALETAVGPRSTLEISYAINPWTFDSDTRGKRFAKHWMAGAEYRWWPCSRYNGHFIGAHLLGGEMNLSGLRIPFPGAFFGGPDLGKAVRNGRYQGEFAGAGVSYGYSWPLTRHWDVEAEIGAGYVWSHFRHYPCGDCGAMIDDGHTNYLGLTRLAFSVAYVF